MSDCVYEQGKVQQSTTSLTKCKQMCDFVHVNSSAQKDGCSCFHWSSKRSWDQISNMIVNFYKTSLILFVLIYTKLNIKNHLITFIFIVPIWKPVFAPEYFFYLAVQTLFLTIQSLTLQTFFLQLWEFIFHVNYFLFLNSEFASCNSDFFLWIMRLHFTIMILHLSFVNKTKNNHKCVIFNPTTFKMVPWSLNYPCSSQSLWICWVHK